MNNDDSNALLLFTVQLSFVIVRYVLFTFGARTQLPQIFEAVDAGAVPVAPFELKRVLADQFNLSEFQMVGNVDGQNDSDTGHLVLARGARTHTSKNGREMMRLVPIGPSDHQLSRMDLLYLRRSACLGTGHFPAYSTSSTGASKVRMLT